MNHKNIFLKLIIYFACIQLHAKPLELLQLNADLLQLQVAVPLPQPFIASDAVGFAEDPNIHYRPTMEDAHTIALKNDYALFCLYDGHGGRAVADFAAEHLHENIINALKEKPLHQFTDAQIRKILDDAFVKTHLDLDTATFNSHKQGCTAIAAFLYDHKIYVANAGDSRVILSNAGTAIALADDHKPDRPDERKRIEELGGKIIHWGVYRVEGILAISRSIGDKQLAPYVIPNPEIQQKDLTTADEFLIIACDGVWDVINNQQAVDIVQQALKQNKNNVNKAADVLKDKALNLGSTDNISVIVVDLRKKSF